jgi:hypothetical protein
MLDWKEIRKKAEKVNGTKAYIINDEFPAEFSTGVTHVGIYNRRIIYLPESGHVDKSHQETECSWLPQ